MKGVGYLLANRFTYCLMMFLGKVALTLNPKLTAFDILFTRASVMLPLIIALSLYLKVNVLKLGEYKNLILIRASFGAFSIFTAFFAYRYIGMMKGMMIMSMGPMMNTFAAWLILKEKLTKWDIISPIVSTLGVLIIFYFSTPQETGSNEPLGALLLFLSTASMSVVVVSLR